jgi:transposase-like protein
MNDHLTISTFQLFQMFPDAESARVYLESRRWPQGPRCPVCGLTDRITTRKGGYYRCGQCKEDFTVRTGTIFERSHVPLHKWLYAMYLLVTARKGISSMQLSKEIGITQKSAWFVLSRIREALGSDLKTLRGIVECDETYIGSKREALKQAMLDVPMVGSGEKYRQQLLDAATAKVLAHKPKPKSKPARKRARRAKKIAQAADV